MPSHINFNDGFMARIYRIQEAADKIDEIMPELEKLAWEDNRDGLLAGRDKHGRRFRKLSPHTVRFRKSAVGAADPKAPPLIPCYERSRLIANYRVTSFPRARGAWIILGAWEDVVSSKGVPFIGFHATGTRRMPRRDPTGVRPVGQQKISEALKTWLLLKWGKPT